MRFLFLPLFFNFFFSQTVIQDRSEKSEHSTDSVLKVGDILPDNILLRLLNYDKKSKDLKEFRGKLLILDFWNTHCGSCYRSFPKIESLQKQFASRMNVLLITDESDTSVLNYFAIRKKLGAYVPSMPVVYRDTILEKLFNHEIEPHEVWIDESGKVIQISDDGELTTKNIQCVLDKGPCKIEQKDDFSVKYDEKLPLFVQGNGGDGAKTAYHSVLSHYIGGLSAMSGYHCNPDKPYAEEPYGILATDVSAIELFQIAYDKGSLDNGLGQNGVTLNRTILHLKDSTRFVPKINGKKVIDNYYCYDLITPVSTVPALKKMMQSDLNRYFGLEAGFEKRRVKCLVLKIKDTSLITSNTDEKPWPLIKDFAVDMKNSPFEKLIFWLNYRYNYPYPLVDETGIKGRVNLKFEADLSDYKSVAAAIKKYSMDLVLEERNIEMLIIRDPL